VIQGLLFKSCFLWLISSEPWQVIPFSKASQLWPAYYMGLALWGPTGKISASVHIQALAMGRSLT